MLDRIDQTIATHDLVPGETHTLIAVSGGADSVGLLHALFSLAPIHEWRLTVAHLDHGLRGTQGSDDAMFVRKLADSMDLDCIYETVDVRSLARRQRQSIEMAGRQARHEFYRRTSEALNIDQVATGHTADDRIETLLLQLARGTGMDALASIPYRTTPADGPVLVRPLLDIRRPAIENWLREQNQAWHNDPSNRDADYRRNRVRHELLPWLESRLNPRVRESLQRLIRQATRDREWIETVAADITRKCMIGPLDANAGDPQSSNHPALDRRSLAPHPAALRHRIIVNWLHRLRIPPPRIDQPTIEKLDCMLVNGHPKRMVLAGAITVQIDNERLACVLSTTPSFRIQNRAWTLPILDNEFVDLDDLGLRVTVTHETGPFCRQDGQTPGDLPAQCTIRMPDSSELPLTIRFRKPGDRLHPTGSGGSRKIQDILTDAKIRAPIRAHIPLLVQAETVVWLPGYRISKHWRVTDPTLTRLRIRIERR